MRRASMALTVNGVSFAKSLGKISIGPALATHRTLPSSVSPRSGWLKLSRNFFRLNIFHFQSSTLIVNRLSHDGLLRQSNQTGRTEYCRDRTSGGLERALSRAARP